MNLKHYLRRTFSLNFLVYQNHSLIWAFLDYQISNRNVNIHDYLVEKSISSVELLIESQMEEFNHVCYFGEFWARRKLSFASITLSWHLPIAMMRTQKNSYDLLEKSTSTKKLLIDTCEGLVKHVVLKKYEFINWVTLKLEAPFAVSGLSGIQETEKKRKYFWWFSSWKNMSIESLMEEVKQPHLDKLQLQKRDLFFLIAFSVIWPAKIQKRRKQLTMFLSKSPAEVKNYPPWKWTDGLSFAQNWVSTSNKSIPYAFLACRNHETKYSSQIITEVSLKNQNTKETNTKKLKEV